MSVLRSHNNKTRGGLGRVCATGMYRSTEHMKFPKFQTGSFVEWKAPLNFPSQLTDTISTVPFETNPFILVDVAWFLILLTSIIVLENFQNNWRSGPILATVMHFLLH